MFPLNVADFYSAVPNPWPGLWGKILALILPPFPVNHRFYYPVLVTFTFVIGIAVAWLPLEAAILLVGGAIFLTLLLIEPTLGLYFLIPIIPFSSLLSLSGGGFKVGLMEMVLLLTIAAGLLRILANQNLYNRPFKVVTGPLLWPFLILIGGVSLSWAKTFSIGASLVETAKWIEMFLLYLFIINLFPAGRIKGAVLVIILAGMSQALLGLYQFIFKVGPEGFLLFDGRFLRAYGTFGQPNPYAGYLGLVLPLVLSLTIWWIEQYFGVFKKRQPATLSLENDVVAELNASPRNEFRGRFSLVDNQPEFGSNPSRSKLFRLLHQLFNLAVLLFPLGLMLAALIASQSRGAWIGFVAASVATLVVRSKKFTLVFIALVVIAAFIALLGSFDLRLNPTTSTTESDSAYTIITRRFADAIAIVTVTDVATTPVTDANFATIERLAHWQAAREMWRDNLWLGVGYGNYAAIYPAYAVGRWVDPLGHAHNYLLNIGAEAGLVGITTYLIFWIFTFGLLWLLVQCSGGFNKAIAAGSVGIIVHLHIHNLVDNLYVQGMYLHIAIILGLASDIHLHNTECKFQRR